MEFKDVLALLGAKEVQILELQARIGQLEKLVGELESQLKEKKEKNAQADA